MAQLYELPMLAEAFQTLSTAINGKKVSMAISYNVVAQRFHLSLSIDEQAVLTGQPMLTNCDLLAPFDFGVGMLVLTGVRDLEAKPDMTAIERGLVKLYTYW